MNIIILHPTAIPELDRRHQVKYFDLKTDPRPKFRGMQSGAQLVIEEEINDAEIMSTGSYLIEKTHHNCATAIWVIDTYMREREFEFSTMYFDHVFCADMNYLEAFDTPTTWLPLYAKDNFISTGFTMYEKPYTQRPLDIGIAGYKGDFKPFRNHVWESMENHFGKRFVTKAGLYDYRYNQFYNDVRIAWNCTATRGCANLRVFEAMKAGCLMITDRSPDLERLFEDGTHLIMYDNAKDCIEKVEYYRKNPEQAEKIAETGRIEVMSKHLRHHRFFTMIEVMQKRGLIVDDTITLEAEMESVTGTVEV